VVAPATAIPSQVSPTASPTISVVALNRDAGPVLIAPAMNSNMFEHPRREESRDADRARRAHRRSGSGYLACGWIGKGRLAEPEDVVARREQLLKAKRRRRLPDAAF
jgi:phosphopantothenoylcysteine decarboxylase/phosphopantothenate--cysteine ligase